jgi:hypothetical protein
LLYEKISGVLLIFAIIISILAGCGLTPGAITSETSTSSDYIELPSTENFLDETAATLQRVGVYIFIFMEATAQFHHKKTCTGLGGTVVHLKNRHLKCIDGSYLGIMKDCYLRRMVDSYRV